MFNRPSPLTPLTRLTQIVFYFFPVLLFISPHLHFLNANCETSSHISNKFYFILFLFLSIKVEYSNLRDIFAKLVNFLTGSNSLDAQIDPLLLKIFDHSSVLISEINRKLIDRFQIQNYRHHNNLNSH